MSNKHIEELLQQCIAAYDAGLTPEECLSAFPVARDELEPLFRQAVSLRVAFAALPSAEFRERTRERLLFAAGRDVSAAFAAQPDPEFIKDARQRFIRAAGAEAQEALRAVPPPRLPFWVNTRRHLLEAAAAASSPQPASRPMGGILALRAGLSMAVVVLAMAVAALAYTVGFNDTPTTNAEFARFQQDLIELQRQRDAGQINPALVQNLTAQVAQLVNQPAINEKLPDLISRQQQVINAAANEGLLAPELAQAQNQQLSAAAEKAELRLSAARAEEPTSTPPPPARTPTAAAAVTTPAPATATPPATPSAPEDVAAGQIRVSRTDDDTGGKAWKTIELANLSFNVPETWALGGGIVLIGGDYGTGLFDQVDLFIEAGSDAHLRVNVETGRIDVIMENRLFTLRTGGADGTFISQEDLEASAGVLVGDLRRVRDTFEAAGSLIVIPATATPTSTSTATPTSTSTATPTSSPAPSTRP